MFSPPKIQTPPPPPTEDKARLDAERADEFLRRNGRASTFVSTPQGRAEGGYGSRTLTGQG